MKFTTTATIIGIKKSKGTLENGNPYDSTKVYVLTDLDDSKGNGKGAASVEYNWGTSDNFDTVKHLPFPIKAECELEIVTNGKTQRTQLVNLKPTDRAKAA